MPQHGNKLSRASRRGGGGGCKKTTLILRFPYVCPEPVLVKYMFGKMLCKVLKRYAFSYLKRLRHVEPDSYERRAEPKASDLQLHSTRPPEASQIHAQTHRQAASGTSPLTEGIEGQGAVILPLSGQKRRKQSRLRFRLRTRIGKQKG